MVTKKMNELFVGIKEIDYIEAQIDALCDKYNNRRGSDYVQQRALFRSYCHDTINVFDECFVTSMLGMMRCKAKLETYQTKDNIDFGKATLDIVNMLWDLKKIVITMVPIKDLPSCRKLTELSPEDIVSKAKDLVKSDIIKAGVSTLLLGSKISDIVNIEDVKSYYSERLSQLQDEIKIKGGTMSPIEQFLLDKFNAEIGYCDTALFKASTKTTERGLPVISSIANPKSVPAPRNSLTRPIIVSAIVKPRPIPIPSKSEGSTGFFEA